MVRLLLKKRCKKAISPQKNVASQLEDKFSKMRITTSQSVVNDHHTRLEFYKEVGIGPQLPPLLFDRVKRVVDSLEKLEKDADDRAAKGRLAIAEAHIKVFADYYRKDLPRGWKYDRANARALLV